MNDGRRMWKDGVTPTTKTFVSLITAFAKGGALDVVVQVPARTPRPPPSPVSPAPTSAPPAHPVRLMGHQSQHPVLRRRAICSVLPGSIAHSLQEGRPCPATAHAAGQGGSAIAACV